MIPDVNTLDSSGNEDDRYDRVFDKFEQFEQGAFALLTVSVNAPSDIKKIIIAAMRAMGVTEETMVGLVKIALWVRDSSLKGEDVDKLMDAYKHIQDLIKKLDPS